MSGQKNHAIEGLLRESAPRALAAVARRFGDFADAEDAVQEATIEAARQWRAQGQPENPTGWLIHVASRRMTDRIRSEAARREREAAVAAEEPAPPATAEEARAADDTLLLMFMCCHPALTPASAIALTLRAVAGLATAEIAAAFLVPEQTMAQRISRAKKTIKESGEPFAMLAATDRGERLRSVLRVIYLIFNEGYAVSAGAELARAELATEAIRLGRIVQLAAPAEPEVGGLLALMLLTEARRPARTDAGGELVPMDEQDRSLWDREL
ncbi:MAG TPA: sigma-70 family RNA polymerase sigma factor, partial [Solirubrobacterales bacterium]|nr:sigma-70 family RNA polymerase sigma factor [Solirubrobacterales bacterium]